MSLERKNHDELLNSLAEHDLEYLFYISDLEVENNFYLEKLSRFKILTDREFYLNEFIDDLMNDQSIPDIAVLVIKQYCFGMFIKNLFVSSTLDNFNRVIDKFKKIPIDAQKIQEIKDKLYQVVLLIEKMEQILTLESLENDTSKREEYETLLAIYNKSSYKLRDSKDQVENETKLIKSIYRDDKIENLSQLNALIADKKQVEIMVVNFDELDHDLAAVMQLRAQAALEKGNELILLSLDSFNKLIDDNDSLSGIHKLSFLHHGKHDFGYVDKVNLYIEKMPDLREIVIRGCGTAKNSPMFKETQYHVKKSKIPYGVTPPVQGLSSLLIQQKNDNDTLYTTVSWAVPDKNNKTVIKQIKNITGISEIVGTKITEQHLHELDQIPGMPLLVHGSQYVGDLRSRFFDNKQLMTKSDLSRAKKAFRRARTETVAEANDDSIGKIWDKMTEARRKRVSLKGYAGAYRVQKKRVLPEHKHDQAAFSKAVRIGRK